MRQKEVPSKNSRAEGPLKSIQEGKASCLKGCPSMNVDILIISHLKDIHWLFYCLQFLEKNWKEPNSKIIVRLEPDCEEAIKDWKVPPIYRYITPSMRDKYT